MDVELSVRLPDQDTQTWNNTTTEPPVAYTLTAATLRIVSSPGREPTADQTIELASVHRVRLDLAVNAIDVEYEHLEGRKVNVRLSFNRPEDSDAAFQAFRERLAISHELVVQPKFVAAKLPLWGLVWIVGLTAIVALMSDVFETMRQARAAGPITIGEGVFRRDVYLPETPLEALSAWLLPRRAWGFVCLAGGLLAVSDGVWLWWRVKRAAELIGLQRIR